MKAPQLPGIVLAPYGTLFAPALATYDQIKKAYERQFPGSPVRMAFTSPLMRTRLGEKEGIIVSSLLGALAQLHDLGCECVAVQSLQIVPGEEFHQVAGLVQAMQARQGRGRQALSRLETGLPLLSNLSDCRAVSSLLPTFLSSLQPSLRSMSASPRDPEKEAVLLVGHGTGHPADALYSLLAQVLRREHKNVFLGTIEGFSGLSELLLDLKGCKVRSVRLLPFLLVAGGHAENDIFGQGHHSWKSTLEREGYEVVADRRGLGERAEIVAQFLEHTRNALQKMK